jgi:uroporphyrinogen decarboxylase
VDIGQARARIGDRVALQGNLDPAVLFAPAEVVQRETEKILASFGDGDGHVFNLGHGISQFTPPETVKILVDCVHQSSPRYHRNSLKPRAS